ncbi:MAG: T9SS type A sorting domain-containing protein [Gracilimonas sp.]|uniref:T9SS type A sorting domain-containing protein n=1 Tax=Gracilimonas sp. TaxID=1974203 RepID=UPI0019AE70D5|nr:T9SS type A sorting domain-containing protein [Gracilimonas sp.]MBD3615118.1 T9SS type A sorting domain-containing protein [Gracilimonas sp.]
MKSQYKVYLLLLSFVFTGSKVLGQNDDSLSKSGLKIIEAPAMENICTFEPTYRDVYYYKKADQRLLKGSERLKTASFQVEYFSDGASWPQQAREAFEYALQIWETHIDSDIPIRVQANWAALDGNTLGSARPTLIVQPPTGELDTWYAVAQASAMTGVDYVQQSSSTDYDIVVNMNSAFDSWYFGTDAETPAGLIDFVTVVLHEIGHGLGFLGSMTGDPEQQIAEWGYGNTVVSPIIYDRFVMDGFGNAVIDENVYPNPSEALYDAVTGMNGGIFFIGDESNEAFENLPVPLFSPSEWEPGSSFSHLDQTTFDDTENALMRPRIDNAYAMHSPGPVMCGMFADKGWPLGGGCLAFLGGPSLITIDETELNFGVTNVGSEIIETISISNDINSENPLIGRVEIVSGTSSFSVENDVVFLNVEPGSSIEIPISYGPVLANESNGELRVTHNGSNQPSPILIPLNGEALEENQAVELGQNYPNPFNATTNIPYTLPKDSFVRLEIYDALGKWIQTLVNGDKQRGKYVQQLQANEFSSGIYIYRILVDGTAKSKKLLLVK